MSKVEFDNLTMNYLKAKHQIKEKQISKDFIKVDLDSEYKLKKINNDICYVCKSVREVELKIALKKEFEKILRSFYNERG